MNILDVKHDRLGKFRRMSAGGGEQKIGAQQILWEKQWRRRQALERKFVLESNGALVQAYKKIQADEQSEQAGHDILSYGSILLDALRSQPSVDWTQLYDRAEFLEPPPSAPAPLQLAQEPRRENFLPSPTRNMLERIRAERREEVAAGGAAFRNAHDEWDSMARWQTKTHDAAIKKFRAATADWEARQLAFYSAQTKANANLDALRRDYDKKKPDAVAACSDLALLAIGRPEGFPAHWWTALDGKTGVATIDYELPSLDKMPSVKAMKYAPARDVFETVAMAPREREALYAEALYQTCLAVLHVAFATDSADAIKAIVFNGWVNFIDSASGRPGRACIMSLQTTKRAFREIDLFAVDPRACFKSLNGTVGAKLAAMTARGN